MKRILLVEDDRNLSYMIKENLEDSGFEVQQVSKGEDAIPLTKKNIYHILIVDVNLGGRINGFELAEAIRKKDKTLPIIFATAKKTTKDIERGFKIGNVDYLKKPFGAKELIFRIKALLERRQEGAGIIRLGQYSLNCVKQILSDDEEEIHLRKKEAVLLGTLFDNIGKVVCKEDLFKLIWEIEDEEVSQIKEASLHNLIYRLRRRLEKDSTITLENIPGSGYMLSISDDQ